MTEDVAVIEQFASPGEIEFNSKTLKMRKKKRVGWRDSTGGRSLLCIQ